MKQDQIIDHVLGLIDHFKGRKETGELTAAEAGIYLKCLGALRAKEAVMGMNRPFGLRWQELFNQNSPKQH